MTDTRRERTVEAANGRPNRKYGHWLGELFVPYLSFSYAEIDAWDDLPVELEKGTPEEIQASKLQAKEANRALLLRMLQRRMGSNAPASVEELISKCGPRDVTKWQSAVLSGDKGKPQEEVPES
ncbi:hypothetical protein [Deinococcus peraridilitoris]|uniref:Uncharacterized protein n=1 Tax=Deinococcus peraridilitoris (strain DSM 19664 / LMG 22246 / CIP 109416 / KR-200) TaxID=937777 RepID=K9ZZJ7_DEIPD|nr:hypothetical protein [Deinococcus peraridilitoris]AFZ67068.1 hypothetical protein Deipe_1527 [Deinococcus peraridilitoris DSM 19664]